MGSHVNVTSHQSEIVNLKMKKRHSPALECSTGVVKGEIGSSQAGTHCILYFSPPLVSKRRFLGLFPTHISAGEIPLVLPEPSHSCLRQGSHQPRTELNLRLHSNCDFRFTFGSTPSGQQTHRRVSGCQVTQGRPECCWPGSIPRASSPSSDAELHCERGTSGEMLASGQTSLLKIPTSH